MKRPIDMNTWPRRSHWNYFRNVLRAEVSMTCRVDVTALIDFCHREGKAFAPVMLHTISKTVNSLDCMKLTADEAGNPAVWDVVHPNFTIFHKDDETFSDVWMEYFSDLDEFIANYDKLLLEYGDKHGIKVRDNQPPNFFPVSSVPWIAYDSFASHAKDDRPPALFPLIDYGKYVEENGKFVIPVSVSIAHAAMDGYHLAKFFELLQENVNSLK